MATIDRALAHLPADRTDRAALPGVVMGQRQQWNTPESRSERLPLATTSGARRWALSGDLRLDNRESLYAALTDQIPLQRRSLKEIGDSELLMAAYLAWGGECAERLLGDFAVAVWDAEERQLDVFRDPMGVKSVYYARRHDGWLVSNDLRAFLATVESPPELLHVGNTSP